MIEILILTGFLGSGKTTLLGFLLRQPEFSRTAVIVNEFGEIGLDHDLIEASEDSLVGLQTGCLCCRIRSDLATTIHDLLRRRDEGDIAGTRQHQADHRAHCAGRLGSDSPVVLTRQSIFRAAALN